MSPDVRREDAPLVADERTALRTWLDYQRATLLTKCVGLSGAQLAQASVPPSDLTLLGLVRHMTLVEWSWFERVFADGPMASPIPRTDAPDADFHDVVPENAEGDLKAFARQCAHSRSVESDAESLDALSRSTRRPPRDLRWIMVHMIEEYARHNGHADLLRECIDGVVGD